MCLLPIAHFNKNAQQTRRILNQCGFNTDPVGPHKFTLQQDIEAAVYKADLPLIKIVQFFMFTEFLNISF